jgi:hypothetical protein
MTGAARSNDLKGDGDGEFQRSMPARRSSTRSAGIYANDRAHSSRSRCCLKTLKQGLHKRRVSCSAFAMET